MKRRARVLSFNALGTIIPFSLMDLQDALDKLDFRVFVQDLPNISMEDDPKLIDIALIDGIIKIQPEIIFTIDQIGLSPPVYPFLQKRPQIISWFFDNPIPFFEKGQFSRYSDNHHTFCWDRFYIPILNEMGVKKNLHYMPFATNPEIYQPTENTVYKYDVSFVATFAPHRAKIIMQLAERGIKIDLFGNDPWKALSHPNITFHGFADNRTECPEIYRSSKINLNISSLQLVQSLPIRIFDVGACKSFIITDHKKDAESLFNEDQLLIYKSIDDLVNKINYYLKHEEEREEIANNFYQKISTSFTYEKQVKKVLELTEFGSGQPDLSDMKTNEFIFFSWLVGLAYMKVGDLTYAESCFDSVLNVLPNELSSNFAKAILHAMQGDIIKVEKQFEKLHQLNHRHAHFFNQVISDMENNNPFNYWSELYNSVSNDLQSDGYVKNWQPKRYRNMSKKACFH